MQRGKQLSLFWLLITYVSVIDCFVCRIISTVVTVSIKFTEISGIWAVVVERGKGNMLNCCKNLDLREKNEEKRKATKKRVVEGGKHINEVKQGQPKFFDMQPHI